MFEKLTKVFDTLSKGLIILKILIALILSLQVVWFPILLDLGLRILVVVFAVEDLFVFFSKIILVKTLFNLLGFRN